MPNRFTYATWARLQAFSAAVFIWIGGLISFAYPNHILAIVSTLVSMIIFVTEYQLIKIPPLYYLRTLVYLGLAGVGMLQAPTHTGSLFLFFAALTYLRAALNGEPFESKK